MIYTSLTRLALKVSFEAHKDQVDHSGTPYVYHPYHLAEQMTDETTTCIALLHDVVEDTDITLTQLREMGFPEDVVEAVEVLTKEHGVPYQEYIERVKSNPLARIVKLADLEHNSDMSRLQEIDERSKSLAKRYEKARACLMEANKDEKED